MKILIVKLGALGDAVMASTMIKALRAKYPGCHITWLCGEEIAPLVRLFGGIDEILTVNNRLLAGPAVDKARLVLSVWAKLWGKRYDYCIVAHSDTRYKLLTATVLCKNKVYFNGPSGPRQGHYHGDEYARFATGEDVNTPGSYPLADVKITPSDAAKDMVLLLPGGAKNAMNDDAVRRWPVQRYRELAEKLIEKGAKVGLIGAQTDLWTEEYFAGLPVTSWIGKTDIPGLLELLAGAKALVSHDSGPVHLCYLVKTPLVALFGPVSACERIPANVAARAVSIPLPCAPCYDGKQYADCISNLCIQGIEVEAVMDELGELNVI